MKRALVSLLGLAGFLYASCYSIETKVGKFTPVYVPGDNKIYQKQCKYLELPIDVNRSVAYIGCYKTYAQANDRYVTLKSQGFHFKDEKIVQIDSTKDKTFIIFPKFSNNLKNSLLELKKKYDYVLNHMTIQDFERKIPTKIYGNGIKFLNIEQLNYLPIQNLYSFYRFYKKHNLSRKVLVLYDGQYSLEYLYKKLHNPRYIQKLSNNTYILKVPIYIAPTATLIIRDKNVKLETVPKPVFIMYHGKLYVKDSDFTTWDLRTNSYAKREPIPKSQLLMIGLQKPRPYFLGMSYSYTMMLNSKFRGLGFHDTIGPFGLAVIQSPSPYLKKRVLVDYLRHFKGSGVFIGNEVYDSMMGFYTNNAKDVLLIANYMHDNLIYNIDPHDYTYNMLMAYNLLTRAKHAHGIVISRGLYNVYITKNLSFANTGNGIMLDRSCYQNLIQDNVLLYNRLAGISLQESDNNWLDSNLAFDNLGDGIIIRNSMNVKVSNNKIYKNRNGIEVIVKNIDDVIYRNFARDVYHKAASAVVNSNDIEKNYNYQTVAKNNAAIYMYNNIYSDSDLFKIGYDLMEFMNQIVKNNYNFKLYGLGHPFTPLSTDLYKISIMPKDVFIDMSYYNINSGVMLGRLYRILNKFNLAKAEFKRESSNLVADALLNYSISQLKLNSKNTSQNVNMLTYLIESVILGSNEARKTLPEIQYLTYLYPKDYDRAYQIVKNRMSQGYLFRPSAYNSGVLCRPSAVTKRFVKAKLEQFEYLLKSHNIRHFYTYVTKVEDAVNIFPRNIDNMMQQLYNSKNKPKIKYEKYAQEKDQKMLSDLLCKRYLDKSQMFMNQTKKIVRANILKDIEAHKAAILDILNNANRFRKDKITFEEFKQMVLKGYE